MLIESVINKKPKEFAKVFESLMAEKVIQAMEVLEIVEAKKLLLGKVEEDELDERTRLGKKLTDITKNADKGYNFNRKQRKAFKTINKIENPTRSDYMSFGKKVDHYGDSSQERKRKHEVKQAGYLKRMGIKEDELDESGLLLKQNRRGRKSDIKLKKDAVRKEPTSVLKADRAKTKYYNNDQADRFKKKSYKTNPEGLKLLKRDGIRTAINKIKMKDPKRLPEQELGEVSKYQKDPEIKSYVSGKGKTPAKLTRDYGAEHGTTTGNLKQRNTRWNDKTEWGSVANKREMKASISGDSKKAEYHSNASFKRYKSDK